MPSLHPGLEVEWLLAAAYSLAFFYNLLCSLLPPFFSTLAHRKEGAMVWTELTITFASLQSTPPTPGQ